MSDSPALHVIKRNGDIVPFDRAKIVNALYKAAAALGAHDRALAGDLAERVVHGLAAQGGTPSVEEIQDRVERVLIEAGHAAIAKAYILYRDERARLRRAKGGRAVGRDDVPYKALWRTLVWNVEHDCHTTAGLSAQVRDGRLPALIAAAEAAYDAQVHEAARVIVEARERTRMVLIAGPSSSGKTTATCKISAELRTAGIEPVTMNLDHYFFDLHLHPRDARGDYDFETPEALDLPLLNEHLVALLAGREIAMPRYDFKTGRRSPERVPLRLAPGQVLLLDTLHGLYDGLSAGVEDDCKFRLYIETVPQLRDQSGRWVRWTDLRLLRRMMRDAAHRGYDPERTILHWHYVRRGELKHIIPHVGRADAVINGALPYELAVLKPHLAPHFERWLAAWPDDGTFADARLRAGRIHALLQEIAPAGEAAVPPSSVLREFIGGSVFAVH